MAHVPQNNHLVLPPSGQGPGVLVLHAWWGLNDFMKDFCRRLAAEGFTVLAPDLYHGKVAVTVEGAKKLRGTAKRAQASAEILAAADQLQALTGGPIGVVGFSLGGWWGVWLSQQRPEIVRTVTLFYATGGGDFSLARAAYQGHFAEQDDWEPASGVTKLEKALVKAGRTASFYTYPGTGHWFFEADRPDSYNPAAAHLAWERTLAFLRGG